MYRLFVAVDLPLEVKEELSRFCCGLPGARWVSSEQLHLTLHFIGEVDGTLYGEVREQLEAVGGEMLEIRLEGFGLFPLRKPPAVLWVGLQKSERLELLRNRIGSALRRAGVKVEKRKFMPHITLARLRHTPLDKLTQFVAAHNLYKSRIMHIEDFKLYSSVLGAKGAVHVVEEVFCLGEKRRR